MSAAQVTKQHLKIIDEIRVGDRSMRFDITDAQAAKLIADSEAKACAELRAVFPEILAALGNGACCAPDVSVEFIKAIPNEVAGVVAQLRAERDWLKTWQDQAETNYVIGEPLAKKLRDTEVERDQLRAEVERLKTQRDNLLKPMREQAIARAELAEAELATERARLDWLMAGGVCMVQHTGGFHVSRLHAPVSRAAIDDAMKEETK